jgi:hypothetical protein
MAVSSPPDLRRMQSRSTVPHGTGARMTSMRRWRGWLSASNPCQHRRRATHLRSASCMSAMEILKTERSIGDAHQANSRSRR